MKSQENFFYKISSICQMPFKQKSFNRSEKLLCGCRRQGGVQYIRKNPNSNIKSVSDTQVISDFSFDENDKRSFSDSISH